MNRILVTGATGNVGSQVAAQLAAEGIGVRALTRRPQPAGALNGAEVATGDLARPESLEAALAEIDTVFLIWPFLTTEGAPAVLEAIGRQARRVVYLSSSGVREDADRQSDPINQLHADMEALIEGSGLEWAVLRSNTIASNTLGWAAQIRDTGVVRGPDIAPTAVVHERDVAAVAVRVLADPRQVAVKHILTGPEVVSRAEQVRAIGEAIGRPLRFEEVPVEVARERMLADGRPPALVEALLASAAKRSRSDLVTGTVEEITGKPARSFRIWADDHADAFR